MEEKCRSALFLTGNERVGKDPGKKGASPEKRKPIYPGL
jgi:hypothetical protein